MQDAGEANLSGWTVYLDVNNNGVLDRGETSTITDATGAYRFGNLGPGTYRVRQEIQAGWQQTTADPADVTTASGMQVIDSRGTYLGTIKVPRQPANCAFAGPGKRTLYITAREGLYKLSTLSQGPNRLGK